jgi:acyl-CoA thioesterase II
VSTDGVPDSVAEPRRTLREILDLEVAGPDRWLAPTPAEGAPRLYGGQVAGQAIRAATTTVDAARRLHSLHSYFIRPGRPGVTLEVAVERTRDGRSFSTRRVVAAQEGEPIFVLDSSFHLDEDGDDWQPGGLPDVPPPDELVDFVPAFSGFRWTNPFDIRPIEPAEGRGLHPCWVRLAEPAPDDDAFHAAALTYVSDLAVVGSARAPGSRLPFGGASLDHAVWFHRPARVDEWLLFSVHAVTNSGARGLAQGTFHRGDGTLVASVSQECLLRPTGT